jgi:hypothetical protein
MTCRLASLFLMLFSPRTVSAACIDASIHVLGVLFASPFASLFLMFFSPRSVSAACIYASIYVFGVLFTYQLTAAQESLNLGKIDTRSTYTS